MNHKSLFLVFGLLVCLVLPLGLVAAEGDGVDAPAAAPTYLDFGEPNDTRQTATPLYDYRATGHLMTAADVDFYRGYRSAAGEVYVSVGPNYLYDGAPMPAFEVAVLRSGGAVADENTSCVAGQRVLLQPTLPAGTFYVRVRPCANAFDPDAPYTVLIGDDTVPATPPTDVEPNDSWQTATPVTYGQLITGRHDGYLPGGEWWECAGDDWYRFQGRAGDVLDIIDPPDRFADSPRAWLYDAAGNRLAGQVVLPADGTYHLRVHTEWWTDDDSWCQDAPYAFTLGESLWISAAADGLGGNAAIKRGDIVTRLTQAGKWTIVFDASDVGITKDVVAFERMPNGSILMSLIAAQDVPGLGMVMPQDIIRFIPTSLGETTAGTFEWFLDGSDVGLTTAGEKIDAIYMKPSVQAPLHISIVGAGSVARQSGGVLKVADEDMINFVQTSFGATSVGGWRMNVDGSTYPGMAVEDINAYERIELSPARLSVEIMTFTDAFKINNIAGINRDVFDLQHGMWARKLADKKIDGLAVGPAWMP